MKRYIKANTQKSDNSIYDALVPSISPIFTKLATDVNNRINDIMANYSISRQVFNRILITCIRNLDKVGNTIYDKYFEFYCEPDVGSDGGPVWFWITSYLEDDSGFDNQYDYIENLCGTFNYNGNFDLDISYNDSPKFYAPNGNCLAAYFDYYFNILNPDIDFNTAISFAKNAAKRYEKYIEDICNSILDDAESYATKTNTEIHYIYKDHGWYDPEGLGIKDKPKALFEGTLYDCEEWLTTKYSEAKHNNNIIIERYVPNKKLTLYYPNAIAKDTFIIE